MTLVNTIPKDILVNPKLTLIAFHLCQELTQEKTADAESIWSRLAKISSYHKIPELQQLPQLIQQSQAVDSDRSEDNRSSDYPLFSLQEKIESLLSDPVLKFVHPASENLPAIEGGIYPIRIHDTYVADLTINYKSDRFPVELLSQVNIEDCLLPSQIEASLGQTVILFDRRIHSEEDYAAIASACIKAICTTDNDFALPAKIDEGKFLGGEIYQFEDDYLDPTQKKHLLVWLATKETKELEKTGDYYYPLLNLLCSRHKIQFAYYQARQAYKQARQLYAKIEPLINSLSQLKTRKNQWLKTELTKIKNQTRNKKLRRKIADLLDPPETKLSDCASLYQSHEPNISDRIEQYLKEFHNQRLEKKLIEFQKQQLEQLELWSIEIPQASINYDICLRNIESHLTTIEINYLNYERELSRLQQIGSPADDLSFLTAFLNNDCSQYQKQIEYDLKYLNSGKTLFDRTIETIRGLLSINAQKQQLVEDSAEAERSRRVELWVTVVASGLAVSGSSSTIMPQPVRLLFEYFQIEYQQTWYGNQASLLLWNLLLHSAIGILAAILVAVVFRSVVESFLEFLSVRIRPR